MYFLVITLWITLIERKTTKDQNTFEAYNNNDSNIWKCLVGHKSLDTLFKNICPKYPSKYLTLHKIFSKHSMIKMTIICSKIS